MLGYIAREAPMWIVEINVLGRKFTHTVGDVSVPSLPPLRAPRVAQWRHGKQRHPGAAA
ncbi:hypothetical protein TUM20984_25390 [Mycobacterium antarcticum]|nr:hypothetical protein TUM20984_25390 [Mycolicibacterium sp. TUM20984]